MEEHRISSNQLFMLIVGSVTVTGHLLFVPIVFDIAGRDSWLSLLIALVPGAILTVILADLAKLAPGLSLVEMPNAIFGKPIGKILGLTYACYFLLPTIITLRGVIDFMATSFMPQTPLLFFGIGYLYLCAFGVRSGLESFIWANEFLMPFLILAGIILTSSSIPTKNYQLLLPFMEKGIGPVIQGSVPLMGLFGEIAVFAMIYPAFNVHTALRKTSLAALLLIGLSFLGPLTGPIAIFGNEAASFVYPTFIEINYIKAGFLESLQPIAILLLLAGSLGKVSLFYYASTLGIAQTFSINDHRKLILPVGLVILVISLVSFANSLVLTQFVGSSYSYISIGLGMIGPVVLWAGLKAKG